MRVRGQAMLASRSIHVFAAAALLLCAGAPTAPIEALVPEQGATGATTPADIALQFIQSQFPLAWKDPATSPTLPIPAHMVEPGQEAHQWIAREAYFYFTSQIEGAELGAFLVKPGLTPESPWDDIASASADYDGDNNVIEGTRDEDISGENPATPGSIYSLLPYLYHFCAGADGSEIDDGWSSYDSALTTARWYWDFYVTPNFNANRAGAYYYLGHVAHLLADMTVPAHTHNDEHPFSEPYEDWIGSSARFTYWYFGCDPLGAGIPAFDWSHPLSVPDTLTWVFYRTANYTEDYDSADVAGDVSNGATPFSPDDYPTTWHRPGDVNRSGGMSAAELTITGDDLMPYAIRRVADLYRLFYKETDATGPVVAMTYPDSVDAQNPTVRTSLDPFDLTATASDPESGVVKQGYRFSWSYQTGSGWSEWAAVPPSPTTSSAAFGEIVADRLYRFHVTAENGGGHQSGSAITYLLIQASPIPTPSPVVPSTGWIILGGS